MASSNIPSPQSFEQILSTMLSAYASSLGINDFNVASVNTSFFEVVALATARATGDLFQVLRDYSVDRATGDALKRLAAEYNITLTVSGPATGFVNVTDTTFTKIYTEIYAGQLAPNIGATTIYVSDASTFPATGSVYLGRGTPDVEGPLPYISVAPQNSYWVITLNPSNPTTKYHNLGETVILAQGGNRTIPQNTIVISPGVGSTASLQYSVVTTATILDGETEVSNIPVTALTPGSSSNIPIGAIKSFASPPFPGATVTNPLPFTTGTDNETDDQIRVAIKQFLSSTGLGTATAVESALIGAYAADENDTIVSDSIAINPATGSATVYIDDGTGYEEKSTGIGLEHIVDSAIGGEEFFQLQTGGSQAPVAKAFLQSTNGAPFALQGGDTLAVVVGETTYQHTFLSTDFLSPGAATAYEVTASINADSTLGFEALTAGGGVYVVIRAIAETEDSIHTTIPTVTSGSDASVILGFPANTIETLRLYKNNIPLTKDGVTATLFSQAQELWSSLIASGDTLSIAVDGTAPITFQFFNSDFLNTGLYTVMAATNSLASWAEVFNNKITGVTTTIVGDQLELTSNLGASNRAQISIVNTLANPSTLVTKGMFNSSLSLTAQGAASDYTLDRNTAQFELVVPLVKGDVLSAGSADTEAFVESNQITDSTLTFASDAHFWVLIDTAGLIIQTGALDGTTMTVSKPSTNIIRYTSAVSVAFDNVLPGDYVIIWSPELPVADQIEGRVHAVTSTTLDILVTAAEYAAASAFGPVVMEENGFVMLRSALAPQKFRVQAGIKTLFQVAAELQTQTDSINFSVSQQEYLTLTTATLDTSGSLLIVTADAQAGFLQLVVGSSSQSQQSLIAYDNSQGYGGEMPLFINSVFYADAYADPINSFISSITSSVDLATIDPNDLVDAKDPNNLLGILQPYGEAIRDAQCFGEYVQETSIVGNAVGIAEDVYVRRVRNDVDRFFLASPLDFGHADTLVTILDNNPVDESFTIPLYRNALTYPGIAVNPSNFDAYDVITPGQTTAFATTFGAAFDFSNFKVLMQAKYVLKPLTDPVPQTAILYRSTPWGRSGEKIMVGYAYPSAATQGISNLVTVGDTVDITIILGSGAAVPTSINSTTQWNTLVASNSPSAGIDTITYVQAGTYTFTVSAATVSVGDIYINNGQKFLVTTAMTLGTTLITTGLGGAPLAGPSTLTKFSGAGGSTSPISYSSYTFAGFGTSPNLVNVIAGNYVNISSSTGFNPANDGVFVVYSSTLTSFTVQVPHGTVVAQSGISTAVNNGILFYASASNTAAQIVVYVNANLALWISAKLVNDGGSSGSGVIDLSTYDDSGYAYSFVSLRDGINWIASSNLATNTIIANANIVGGNPILNGVFPTSDTYLGVSYPIQVYPTDIIKVGASVSGPGGYSGTVIYVNGSDVTVSPTPSTSYTSASVTFVNTGTPQFILKNPLTYDMDQFTGLMYQFNNGENLVFVPTTIDQVQRLISTFAVSGFLTDGEIDVVDRNQYLELSTDTLGSAGAVQVVGGSGNQYGVPILDSAVLIDSGHMEVSVNNVASQAVHSGQWFRLQAASAQKKITGMYSNTDVQVIGNDPVAGSSEIILTDRTLTERYFGRTRTVEALGGSFRVEKQGSLVCITFTGSDPAGLTTFILSNAVSFSNSGGTNLNITLVPSTSDAQLFITSGATFSGLSIGDYITVSGLAVTANNGTFLVTGVSDDGKTLQITNPNAVAVTGATYNSSAFTARTGVSEGDTVIVGPPFALLNQGTFRVIRTFTDSFWIENADAVEEEQIASNSYNFTITSGNASAGATYTNNGHTFTVLQTIIGGTTLYTSSNSSGPLSSGTLTKTSGTGDATITFSAFSLGIPSLTFYEYEATVPGDLFVVTGSVLGVNNAGTYTVTKVLNTNGGHYNDTVVVSAVLNNIGPVPLVGFETALYVLEGIPYYGYKHVYLVAAEPNAPTRNLLVFDTINQYEKIDGAAGVEMTSLNKLDFNTAIQIGLDSYRYNTGLIAEANRIVYGDPRDSTTYPGVGAAGADIFIRAPLVLRVTMAIEIRLQTGVSFTAVSQQVRSNISSLVNSNPVGQSIDISSIISTARAVPGIISVAISSPLYSDTSDLIQVAPSEKTIIIDPSTDISVSQIGS